jgi:hypothetical protein
MLYALLCYHDEALVNSWTKEEDEAVLAKRATVTDKLAARGKLGPALRPMPTTATTTVRFGREPLVIDGPFAESKEQLLASTSSIVRRSKRPSSLPARSGAMRPAPSKSARSNCTRLGAKCLGAKCRGAK